MQTAVKRALVGVLLLPTALLAQSTVATGDSRTVTEPTYPRICATVAATKYMVRTNAVNIDPYNATCGSTGGTFGRLGCTGGTDYQPSSTASPTYTAAESLDNAAITSAMSSCPVGQAVELVQGASGQTGFVIGRLAMTRSLVVDAGVHVNLSRNLSDYPGTNCGVVTTGSSSCPHAITAPNTNGLGIYGPGVIDGRGWASYIGLPTQSFYANRIQAYCNLRSGASHGSPLCTPGTGNSSYGPNLVDLVNTTNFTMYKVTLKDAGNFFLNLNGGSGFTAWGVKIIGPFEVSNTDGWDPQNFTNATFTHGVISNGDNHMAVKAPSGPASNISFTYNQTGAGIGIAIGANTLNGVSNVLVDTILQNGNLYNDQSAGIQIGSDGTEGGLVDTVTFSDICMRNERDSMRFYTNYGSLTGANTPIFHNLLVQNVTVNASTAPYTTGNAGYFTIQGLSGNPITAQFDNINLNGINQGVAQQGGVTTDQYANVFTGYGGVPSSILSQLGAGTGVTTSGIATPTTPYPCSNVSWHPLIGELSLKSVFSNNAQSYAGASPVTLQAVLEPATAINTKESSALTAAVNFYDNGVLLGSAPLSGDGTLAAYTLTPASGTHYYTATYPGDATYSSFTFGSVQVTNNGTPISVKGNLRFAGRGLTIR